MNRSYARRRRSCLNGEGIYKLSELAGGVAVAVAVACPAVAFRGRIDAEVTGALPSLNIRC
jgi:hypothetical protein